MLDFCLAVAGLVPQRRIISLLHRSSLQKDRIPFQYGNLGANIPSPLMVAIDRAQTATLLPVIQHETLEGT